MVQADFDVTTQGSRYFASMTVSGKALLGRYTELCFSLSHPFDSGSLEGGTLVERQGDWHRIALAQPFGGQCLLTFSGNGGVYKSTDYPYGVYLQGPDGLREVKVNRPIRRNYQNSELPVGREASFIPLCHAVHGEDILAFPKQFAVRSSQWNVSWFQRLFARLNLQLTLSDDGYELCVEQNNGLTTPFELAIAEHNLTLMFRDEQGFQLGQAYVLQYLLQWSQTGSLASVTLIGSEVFEYRGVHLDVVRHFFEAEDIMGWLDVLALFQYNHFHWHLTDDDGWRVPSSAFPQLAQIAGRRGPNHPLPPQMGTGMYAYSGVYTVDAIHAVVSRAAELGIDVVPEMDLPGHARALLKALPQLVEPNDESVYLSVQHHNDNVINPAYKDTLEIIKTLIDEWCQLFPGSLFHVGSDEVPKGVWQKSPAAQAWSVHTGKPIEALQGLFLSAIEQHLRRHGKTMAGWEEVRDGGGASTDTWVYSWQGVEAGRCAAEAGHPVVMTPAQYCYLDLAVSAGSADPGQYWAGTVNLRKVLSYRPLEGLSVQAQRHVKGIQMCLWTEVVLTPKEVEYMWFPRLLAGAQLGILNNTNFDDRSFFLAIKPWASLLSRMGLGVRSENDGW